MCILQTGPCTLRKRQKSVYAFTGACCGIGPGADRQTAEPQGPHSHTSTPKSYRGNCCRKPSKDLILVQVHSFFSPASSSWFPSKWKRAKQSKTNWRTYCGWCPSYFQSHWCNPTVKLTVWWLVVTQFFLTVMTEADGFAHGFYFYFYKQTFIQTAMLNTYIVH